MDGWAATWSFASVWACLSSELQGREHDLRQTITVYCSSSDAVDDVYKAAAYELGTLIARRGYN